MRPAFVLAGSGATYGLRSIRTSRRDQVHHKQQGVAGEIQLIAQLEARAHHSTFMNNKTNATVPYTPLRRRITALRLQQALCGDAAQVAEAGICRL